jgi:hypothetical protein
MERPEYRISSARLKGRKMEPEGLGAAVISIDVGSSRHAAVRRAARPETFVPRLVRLFDDFQIAATWAIAEPADDEATAHVLTAEVRHEIAILGDAGWIGESAGRPAFACNLARRIVTAQAAGISIRVLACGGACVPRTEYDLLVKHNIHLVRQPRPAAGNPFAALQPLPLRHGVWEAPATVEIPRANAWWGAGAGAAKNSFARAAATHGVAHVTIDLAALAACDARLHTAQSILRRLAEAASRAVLDVMTLGALGEKMSRPKAAASARSILRAA